VWLKGFPPVENDALFFRAQELDNDPWRSLFRLLPPAGHFFSSQVRSLTREEPRPRDRRWRVWASIMSTCPGAYFIFIFCRSFDAPHPNCTGTSVLANFAPIASASVDVICSRGGDSLPYKVSISCLPLAFSLMAAPLKESSF